MTNKVIPSFRKSKHADKGKDAEGAVHKFFSSWIYQNPTREFNRLLDTKAAGRIVKAAPADFDFYALDSRRHPCFGLIEVKQTAHLYRLERAKVPQLPQLIKRTKCGGECYVLVHHSVPDTWRCLSATWMAVNGDKGSWNVRYLMEFGSPGEALHFANPLIF